MATISVTVLLAEATVLAAPSPAAPFLIMWLIVAVTWLAGKLATWLPARRRLSLAASAEYLLLWPGMDPEPFVAGAPRCEPPTVGDWLVGVGNAVSGAGMLWLAAVKLSPDHPTASAWVGMIGFAQFLHFGLFRVGACVLRARGINVVPVMDRPLSSRSLSDFWARRWNTAFHALAERYVFRPACRRRGAKAAAMAVFVASGLIHDLVLSAPAGGGYGLPTAYFVLNGVGVLLERSALGRRIGLNRPPLGWVFAVVVTAAPAAALFHPWFIQAVAAPFFAALGSWR